MSYEKQIWTDGVSPLNAERFNHMEEGIFAAHGSKNEPADNDIPKVFLSGDAFADMTNEKNEVDMAMEYISKTDRFFSYIKIKFQGTSSLAYPKKNFTVKLYSDEARETKLKKDFKDWNHPGNKFVLKANWIDHSHARNIVSANLWSEVVACRSDYESLPEELRNSPRNGAIDGFPVKLYVNGTYQGVYTWNIGKDDWQFGMDEDNPNHVLLCNEDNSLHYNACNFRGLWDGFENTFAVEVGTNSTAVKNSLNTLITCVKDTDDATFKATIGQYLDVQSAIDYYLHQYVIAGLDGLGKNMLLATYDGVKWYLSAYDMDSTFGLWWNGESFVSAEYRCPYDYEQPYNLLFERIRNLFREEMVTRYAELRDSVYSYANIISHFEDFCGLVGSENYADDLVVYPEIPSAENNNLWQLRNYVRDRLHNYCDPHMLGNSAPTMVEYIEGDGNSWINTGIYPDADMVIDCSLRNPAQENAVERFFGTRADSLVFYHYAANYVRFRINGVDHAADFGIGGYHNTASKKTYSFDLSVEPDAPVAKDTILLFTRLSSAVYYEIEACGTFQLYNFKITRKSTQEVLLDLLPAVDAEGRPGMFDSVTQRMLYNDGTGAFIVPTATVAETTE